MLHTTLVFVHICGAVIGMLSGMLAMVFRKGSGLHGAAGTVFFVSMLAMSSSAAFVAAFLKPEPINVIAGLITFYLVATAWRAAKNKTGNIAMTDVVGLLFVLGIVTSGLTLATKITNTGERAGLIIFSVAASLLAISDVRMLVRGTLAGRERIARHLWRMGLALLIALLSFYPGRAQMFPTSARTPLLFVPHILVFGSMVIWRYRMRAKRAKRNEPPATCNAIEGAVWTA